MTVRKQRGGGASPSCGSNNSDVWPERDPQAAQPNFDKPDRSDVDFERRPVLWLPDGRALVRRAGF